MQIIDKDILDDILHELEKAKRKIRDAIKEPDRVKKHRILDEVNVIVCDFLRTIKRFNGGILPDLPGDDLYRLWLSYNCQ